jgi:hypothetical protein
MNNIKISKLKDSKAKFKPKKSRFRSTSTIDEVLV